MYHLVYLTTNLINNKIYVGVHSTYNLDDGYLGTGKTIVKSIKKNGKHNFKRQILYYCCDVEHAYDIEKQIVTKDFIKRDNVYNIIEGGRLVHNAALKGKISNSLRGIKRSQETKTKVADSWVIRNKNKDPKKRTNSALQGEETKRKNFKMLEECLRYIIESMFPYFYFDWNTKITIYNSFTDKQTYSYVRDKFPSGYQIGTRQLYQSQDYRSFVVNYNNPLEFLLNHKLIL